MTYRVLGLMSGSSLDGLDLAFCELTETGGRWQYEVLAASCYPYERDWQQKLSGATALSALDYQLLHTAYGHYTGEQVLRFLDEHNLHFKVALIASHGHTTFHRPAERMTAQLGDGAAIAAVTGLPVVSDLRALDVAFGGQGAPIVPIAEKLLFPGYDYFLNIGGIANISVHEKGNVIAFDICAANRVLNMLAQKEGKDYDDGGAIASFGQLNESLLEQLNTLSYYKEPFPKSLANDFGTGTVFPIIEAAGLSPADALHTYTEHIAVQVRNAVAAQRNGDGQKQLLVTGGGAYNTFLIERLQHHLSPLQVEVVVPDAHTIAYKEALAMALIGVLRWRQEYNVLSSVTGASRDSIGGAVWQGQEA
jgi:anhydro-N-acetylmuramic acid kinase